MTISWYDDVRFSSFYTALDVGVNTFYKINKIDCHWPRLFRLSRHHLELLNSIFIINDVFLQFLLSSHHYLMISPIVFSVLSLKCCFPVHISSFTFFGLTRFWRVTARKKEWWHHRRWWRYTRLIIIVTIRFIRCKSQKSLKILKALS